MQGWVHVQRPPCMSAVLASVGVLIKGLSSLCLPGSSTLTRGWVIKRGAVQRGWRRGIAVETRAGDTRLEGGDWWQTDRREGRPGAGVCYADLLKWQRHELFPWQALPLLCQLILIHGAWSSSICCLLSQIIWTLWHEMDKPSCPHMIPVLPNEIPPPTHNMTIQSSSDLTQCNKRNHVFIRSILISPRATETLDNTTNH